MQPDCSGQLTSQILLIMKVTSLVVLKIKTLATWFRKQHPEDPAFSWTAVKALVVVIMWFSVVWALANCSNFALHPALTGLESTVSRHPLLLLHQFIPMFISYKQSMRQAAETSETAFASIAFCAWLSARATWASKVLSFIGNNGWESALTLRFWMGLGPFLTYLSMLANNEWPSLPILARIQLSTAGLEFVEGRGRNKRVLSYLESKKATTKWLRHHTSLYVAEWGQWRSMSCKNECAFNTSLKMHWNWKLIVDFRQTHWSSYAARLFGAADVTNSPDHESDKPGRTQNQDSGHLV